MSKANFNTVPCCFTDFGAGRIRWEWHEGHWIMVVKPEPASRLR
jgi:hypothetical protein